jgi:hypothetical protein
MKIHTWARYHLHPSLGAGVPEGLDFDDENCIAVLSCDTHDGEFGQSGQCHTNGDFSGSAGYVAHNVAMHVGYDQDFDAGERRFLAVWDDAERAYWVFECVQHEDGIGGYPKEFRPLQPFTLEELARATLADLLPSLQRSAGSLSDCPAGADLAEACRMIKELTR